MVRKSTDTHRGGTVYILGAGASHEGGVPLSRQILHAGYQLLCDLREQATHRRSRGARRDYLQHLSKDHLETFSRVFDFIATAFQGRRNSTMLDLERLPTLDELWALLEIAYQRRAHFGHAHAPDSPGHVRNALMTLMYHVLVGCRIEPGDASGTRISYRPGPNPYNDFVKQIDRRDVVIALNYDTLLDRALHRARRGIDYGTDFLEQRPRRSISIRLLKLHGSFNWLWCPSCNVLQDYGGENVAYVPLEVNHPDEPCPLDGTPRQYVIVPPSLVRSYDNPHLFRIWDEAAKALRECMRLVCIGYSMSDSDIHVKYLIKQATSLNPAFRDDVRRVTVVNAHDRSFQPYLRLFGDGQIDTVVSSFGDFVRSRKR